MSRYVIVSTDASDKIVKAGPIIWDGIQAFELPASTQTMLESAALSTGYTYPAPSTADVNIATLQSKASAALTLNATFLAIGSPTNAQTLAQVQLLTRENSTIIRLLLGSLDTTAGT